MSMPVLSRFAGPLLAGVALSVLSACAPAEGPDTSLVEEVTALEEVVDEMLDEDLSDAADAPADEAAEPAAAEHTHDDDHDHDEHVDDHAHDHDHDHDHAGGTAHVHGVADLALVLEGNELTAELISPLANFGLSEADGVISPEVIESLPRLILLTGGNCVADTPEAEVDRSSGHTDGKIQFSWTCANPSDVMFASFAGFTTYPGFETVNTIFINGGAQKAAALTPTAPQISLR